MNLPDRSLHAAVIVILGLAFFSVLTSVYPIAGFNIQSVDEPIIPVWEPGDEEPRAEQSEDDTPTPTLLSPPTQSPPSEAAETTVVPWTSEVVEAALRELFVEEPMKLDEAAKGDDLLAVLLITLTVASQTLYYPRLNLRHWKTLLLPPKILP
jgi:hypothetical protein